MGGWTSRERVRRGSPRDPNINGNEIAKTSQERKSARIRKKARVKHGHLSFMNSEGGFCSGGDGRQIEWIKEMREKEGKQQMRTAVPQSLEMEDKSKMTWEGQEKD